LVKSRSGRSSASSGPGSLPGRRCVVEKEFKNLEELESHEHDRDIPLGWWALFWGLIIFGVIYTWLYTPGLGGWSQERAYQESVQKQ
jgi:hypothetical protein